MVSKQGGSIQEEYTTDLAINDMKEIEIEEA